MKPTYIINFGNELLRGEIVNSNAAYISRKLTERGVTVASIITLPDDFKIEVEYLGKLLKDRGIFIITGGLGGTRDDVTRKIICKVLCKELCFDVEREKVLKKWYALKGREFEDADRLQAAYPEGGGLLQNDVGLAHGFYIKNGNSCIFSLPGVPNEMKHMFNNEVLPMLEREGVFHDRHRSETLSFICISEYSLDRIIQGAVTKFKNITHGTRSCNGVIQVRFESKGEDLEPCIREVERRLRKNVVGRGAQKLEQVVGYLLKKKKLKLAVAESCTGGLLSKIVTDIPGSSDYFSGGVVSYDNEAKESILGVSHDTLQKSGAVSSSTALEMAAGVQDRYNSDISLSITGIAGPGGGTEDKPVGTVYICLNQKGKKPFIEKNEFLGDRETIRIRSVNRALSMLLQFLREY